MTRQAVAESSELVELSLEQVIRRISNGRRLMLALTLAGALAGIVLALLWKPWYIAQAVFEPPKQSDSLMSSATPSAALLMGSGDSSDIYLGLLMSRTVQDEVIHRLGLMQIWHAKTIGGARGELGKLSKFKVDRSTFISITTTTSSPTLSADIANAYLEALYKVNGQMMAVSADHRRVFLQQQLKDQADALAKAEYDLQQTEERTGVVLPLGEAQAGLAATNQLQDRLSSEESRLAGLLVAQTDQSPIVVQSRARIAQLHAQVDRERAKVQGGNGKSSQGSLPGRTLAYLQKEREVKLNEAAYDALIQQYGRARIAASDSGPQLQIVDYAIPAEGKAGPNLRFLLLAGAFVGFLLGVLYLLLVKPLLFGFTRASANAAARG